MTTATTTAAPPVDMLSSSLFIDANVDFGGGGSGGASATGPPLSNNYYFNGFYGGMNNVSYVDDNNDHDYYHLLNATTATTTAIPSTIVSPLDPIVKDLKRQYASAAGGGPLLLLTSTIISSTDNSLMECDLSGESSKMTSTSMHGKMKMMGTRNEPENPVGATAAIDAMKLQPPPTAANQQQQTHQQQQNQQYHQQQANMQQQQQRRRRNQLPPFCHAPSSHAKNLLRTTPHLRHLSPASMDMSGDGRMYDESNNIFAKLSSSWNSIGKKKRMSHGCGCIPTTMFTTTTSYSSSSGNDGTQIESPFILLSPSASSLSSNISGGGRTSTTHHHHPVDYHTSLLRQSANRHAALELASFLRRLSDEMPQEEFIAVEKEVYSKVFALVHSKTPRADDRLAGVAALDALLSVPSADEERRAIRFGNSLSNGLKIAGSLSFASTQHHHHHPYSAATTTTTTTTVDYEFVNAIACALGRLAMGSTNVDRVEFEIGRSLEWLRSERSDRRLAAVLVLREMARCAPTAFYSRTQNYNANVVVEAGDSVMISSSGGGGVDGGGNNVMGGVGGAVVGQPQQHAPTVLPRDGSGGAGITGLGGTNDFLDHILPALWDSQPIVRACAADALSECLAILMERQPSSMTALLCALYASMMEGLRSTAAGVGGGGGTWDRSESRTERMGIDSSILAMNSAVHSHGSLLMVSEMIQHSRNFILPRFDELCIAVLTFMKSPLILIRLEVMRLIPKLAHRCPEVFGRRYLNQSLDFLLASASSTNPAHPSKSSIDVKPTAIMSIGLLALAMSDEAMGGGDITIPAVRIVPKLESECTITPFSLNSTVENGEFDYHFVEYRDQSDFQEHMPGIFFLISDNLKRHTKTGVGVGGGGGGSAIPRCDVLGCFTNLVEALGEHAAPYVMDIVEDMFQSGLSEDLIKCIHSIRLSIPSKQYDIERRLFQEISFCLAGKVVDLFSFSDSDSNRITLSDNGPISTSSATSTSSSTKQPTSDRNFTKAIHLTSLKQGTRPKRSPLVELEAQDSMAEALIVSITKSSYHQDHISINKSTKSDVVDKLVLSLRTLRTMGDSCMQVHATNDGSVMLPFLKDVISMYFHHPSSSVRREAAMTCCVLLLPLVSNSKKKTELSIVRLNLGSISVCLVEEILQKLLRMAVSDSSPGVRLSIVCGLDERYDAHLSLYLISPLFLLLEDESLAVRTRTLQILGRLSRLNAAFILPGLRTVLMNLIIELQCGGDSCGGREVATRLITIFLREEALQRLTRPFISSIIDALPLAHSAPRLATASLEALGELATVAHTSINPWIRQLISHILENIQDQNTLKQRVGLWALGRIAFGTKYVVNLYLDYPQLLTLVSDILPTTKKAPWNVRREVFRTFGVLGALDPDRFGSGSSIKGGGKGGGYFVELEDDLDSMVKTRSVNMATYGSTKRMTSERRDLQSLLISPSHNKNTSTFVEQLLTTSGAVAEQTQEFRGSMSSMKDSDDNEPAHLYMYEQYAMTAQPLSKLCPARRLSHFDDAFYPTVSVQALMRILKDSSLSNLHGMVMKAVMFIFNALGLKSVPFLKNIVPHILATVRSCGQHGLREALLQQVANLSSIVREHLRPYLPAIFDVVEEFWFSRHLASICSMVERVASAVPDDFRAYVPLLVRQVLSSIEAIDLTEWNGSISTSEDIERLELILKHVQGIKGVLGEYVHLVVPALVKLTDVIVNRDSASGEMDRGPGSSKIAIDTIETLSLLLQTIEVNLLLDQMSVKSSSSLPARVVQPFLRILGSSVSRPNKEVGIAIVECICICVRQLGAGRWMSFYHEEARNVITCWQRELGMSRQQYLENGPIDNAVGNQQHLPVDMYDEVVADIHVSTTEHGEFWSRNGFQDEDVSGSDYSLGKSGSSHSSISRIGEKARVMSAPTIQLIPQYQATAHKTNQSNLQKAWDVSQRSTREDWDEWMRRFSVQLLREAPSPALRACAELAQTYQPLARELFSAAFVCCWGELNDHYRSNLVLSLEVVFSADASLEILQLLLNLAEFMEHDVATKNSTPGLSIDKSALAELALRCRAYARALHYKEREYVLGRSASCVEQLIDINKKLDLPEAALGILKAAKIEIERRDGRPFTSHNRTDSRHEESHLAYSVITSNSSSAVRDEGSWAGDIMYESWLAKLGAWAEAVEMYEEKLKQNPNDVNSILGCMQCYDARGEWQKALDLAGRSWGTLAGNNVHGTMLTSWQPRTKDRSSVDSYRQALKFCSQAAWRLSKWDELETYSSRLAQRPSGTSNSTSTSKESRSTAPELDFDGAFYRAVLHIHRAEWDEAAASIDTARNAFDSRFTALLAESYKRAYPSMVAAQELSELEEIISYRQFEMRTNSGTQLHVANRPNAAHARNHLLNVWRQRLNGCRVDAKVHSSIMAVRSLILGPTDEVDATITLSALSRQAEAFQLAERTLLDPLHRMNCSLNSAIFGVGIPSSLGLGFTMGAGESIESIVNGEIRVQMNYKPHQEKFRIQLIEEAGGEERLFIQHKLYFEYLKHLWTTDRRDEAMTRLGLLCAVVDLTAQCNPKPVGSEAFHVSCWLRFGDWKIALCPQGEMFTESLAAEVLVSYSRATDAVQGRCTSYRAWHSWALINFRLAEQIRRNEKGRGGSQISKSPSIIRSHIIAAIKGFVRAISVGTKRWSASVQQDLLNLLSCLFKYGELQDVATTINSGLGSIQMEAWLGVLPQLLARIHIKSPAVRSVLHPLLVRLGAKHPQALMYPLSVLLKSPVVDRKVAAVSLMNSLKAHSRELVEEALVVSSELIRVAILWLELWHEGLEDASRLYYGEGNVSGMLDVLIPLHAQLEKGASTRREQDFLKSFGRDLQDAHKYIQDYVKLITDSGQSIPTQGGFLSPDQAGRSESPANAEAEAEAALNQAWDLYYTVFRRINKQLPGLTTLELDQCSPALYAAKNLELGVPGSYRVDGSYVKIQRFVTDVQVITSKQRPRKITMRGNDGKDYVFLLKGHEDLRQDERVMQLFGLVNALLVRDRRTNKHDLNIQRYAIAPLSHNAGVVGWVPHCDTLHCLIRDYREANKIPLNAENREMMALAPNYDSLTVMQKVEIFTEALERTPGKGNDIYEVLWSKSTNSEEWLERRTNFTRSLAVMSMVGYILGLGDRHPSNLMLDQISGRVLHIDFGDCFEVAMHRDKFPEKVPFRLTRMLTRAMEVSGIEGSYRSTCERTMAVLRDNKDSLVAMLEAFVYDPLISWRLLDQAADDTSKEAEIVASSNSRESSSAELGTSVSEGKNDVVLAHTALSGPIQEVQDEDKEEEEEEGGDTNHRRDENDHRVVGHSKVIRGEISDDASDSESSDGPIRRTDASSLGEPSRKLSANIAISHGAATVSASHAKSLQIYSEMRALSAKCSSRIASITSGSTSNNVAAAALFEQVDKSVRQRGGLLSMIDGDSTAAASEEALNERALKVIRRVQDKLNGRDFHSSPEEDHNPHHYTQAAAANGGGGGEGGAPLDVQDQVQRLIVQATSSENLSQLFVGWCAFW